MCGGYSIQLSLYFGASQRQAIAFYNSDPILDGLKDHGWSLFPNFHVSFMTSNLVWFPSDNGQHYLQFWKNNVEKIRQQKKADVPKYLKWLIDEKVIAMPKEVEEQLDRKFYDTAMQNLNMCPEFGVIYPLNSSEAETLDKSGKLKVVLVEKIKEGLKIVGLDGHEILKEF